MNFILKQKLHSDESFVLLEEKDEIYIFLLELVNDILDDPKNGDINIIFIERICQLSERDLYLKLSNDEIYLPTVFIGILPLPRPSEYFKNIEQFNCYLYDNSIWAQYMSLCDYVDPDQIESSKLKLKLQIDLKKELKEKIDFIKENIQLRIYETVNALEYNELIGRLAQVNTIGGIGGHGSQIKPLIFHSESIARSNSKRLLEDIDKNLKNELNLKLLLIDDFGDKNLNLKENKIIEDQENLKRKCINVSKKEILENRMSYFQKEFESEKINLLINGNLEIASSIEEGLNKIEDNSYDIVLLDFLFSFKNLDQDRYGTELLEKIDESHSKNQPLKKVWILPITAYNTAFQDHMRFRDISYINKYFELSRGADFINTPYLFLYELLSIIKQQIDLIDDGLFNTDFFGNLEEQVRTCFNPDPSVKKSFYQDVIRREMAYEELIDKNWSVVRAKVSENQFIKNKESTKRLFGHLKSLAYNIDQRPFHTNEHIFIEFQKCKNLYDKIMNAHV